MVNPQFSIIIPCYNQSHFLEDCLNSIFVQKTESWEAILVNDGSSDSTKEIGLEFTEKDSRIKYSEHENKGLSAARNTGISLAKGEFLIFLDADDWLESSCLITYLDYTRKYPDIDLFRCGYAYWDRLNGRKYHSHLLNSGLTELVPHVLTQNIGPCHSILIRRSFVDKLGGFDPSLKSCEDWDFWIRAGKLDAKMISVPDVLVAYRYVPTSMSRNAYQMYASLSEVSKRAFDIDIRLPKNAPFNLKISTDMGPIQKHHHIRCLGILIHQGKPDEAARWFIKEQEIWNWEVSLVEWQGLSSALSWRYFLDYNYIEEIFMNVKPLLSQFFLALGYEDAETKKIISNVIKPQRFRLNHYRYGKILGALINRFLG